MPGCIHTVLVLADRDLALRMEKPTAVHVSLKSQTNFSLHQELSGVVFKFEITIKLAPWCENVNKNIQFVCASLVLSFKNINGSIF